MITLAQLQAVCQTEKGRAACAQYLDPLNRHMPAHGITGDAVPAFLAQIAHESADFTRVVENLNYSADGLANTWPKRYGQIDMHGRPIRMAGRVQPNALAQRLHRDPRAIANNVYANRMGNGNEASGDGWKHRGAGLKQLTGKDNHRAFGAAIGVDIAGNPELLQQPEYAVWSACWFWKTNGLGRFVERGDFRGLTFAINGGLIGFDERQDYYRRAQEVLA